MPRKLGRQWGLVEIVIRPGQRQTWGVHLWEEFEPWRFQNGDFRVGNSPQFPSDFSSLSLATNDALISDLSEMMGILEALKGSLLVEE